MKAFSDAGMVLTFDAWVAVPMFHELADGAMLADAWRRYELRTACGRLWFPQERSDGVDRGTFLRRDHARLIGRPCSRCRVALGLVGT